MLAALPALPACGLRVLEWRLNHKRAGQAHKTSMTAFQQFADAARPVARASVIVLLYFSLLAHASRGENALVPPLPPDRLPAELPIDLIPLGLDANRPIPADNQLTAERVRLGRKLFFDPILSADGSLACASCHDPEHGFAGREAIAVGLRGGKGTRNAPSLLNRAYAASLFWDGRAATLETQALGPIENPLELGSPLADALARLAAEPSYRDAFSLAYEGGITAENLARALASFERVLLSGASPVDRFLAGEVSALSDAQRQGLWLFESRGRCWRCHGGHNYTDEQFHNTGVAWRQSPPDPGRHQVTGEENDRGRFKTPSLRGVAETAPYMHDGSLGTLREVVEFYNQGGGQDPNRDPHIAPLGLTAEQVGYLVEFLGALSGPAVGESHAPLE